MPRPSFLIHRTEEPAFLQRLLLEFPQRIKVPTLHVHLEIWHGVGTNVLPVVRYQIEIGIAGQRLSEEIDAMLGVVDLERRRVGVVVVFVEDVLPEFVEAVKISAGKGEMLSFVGLTNGADGRLPALSHVCLDLWDDGRCRQDLFRFGRCLLLRQDRGEVLPDRTMLCRPDHCQRGRSQGRDDRIFTSGLGACLYIVSCQSVLSCVTISDSISNRFRIGPDVCGQIRPSRTVSGGGLTIERGLLYVCIERYWR